MLWARTRTRQQEKAVWVRLCKYLFIVLLGIPPLPPPENPESGSESNGRRKTDPFYIVAMSVYHACYARVLSNEYSFSRHYECLLGSRARENVVNNSPNCVRREREKKASNSSSVRWIYVLKSRKAFLRHAECRNKNYYRCLGILLCHLFFLAHTRNATILSSGFFRFLPFIRFVYYCFTIPTRST